MQQDFPTSEPAKEGAFMTSVGPDAAFQDPFVDIPPMLCGVDPSFEKTLTSLELSPSEHEDFCTQSQQSLDGPGTQGKFKLHCKQYTLHIALQSAFDVVRISEVSFLATRQP